MAKFEIHIEADTYEDLRDMIIGTARGVCSAEKLMGVKLDPPDLPERKGHVEDPGVKVAPKLGTEKGAK